MPPRNFTYPEFIWQKPAPLIEVSGLDKVFKTPAGQVQVLKQINLQVAYGEFVSIIGRSGSGKSTLINMLTGIDHPTAGHVRIGDTFLEKLAEGKMAEWRGRMLGIVFQFFQLLPTLSLLENVLLPMDFCNMYPPAEREPRALALLARVGLEAQAHKLPGAVSGGQQQAAAVARALANDPPILVADEPTGNLDSASAEVVMRLFHELVGQGKTILMVTHDRSLARQAMRSVLLSDGELVDENIARAFPNLPDEALLQLSHAAASRACRPSEPVALEQPGVVVVRDGALLLKGCPAFAGESGEPARILPGQWLDLRKAAGDCEPGACLEAWPDGPAVYLWIGGDEFDRIAAPRLGMKPTHGGH